MSTFATLIAALPEIIKIIQLLQEAIKNAESDRKVKDDLKAIGDAFQSKDPSKLQHIFDS